MKRKRYDRSGRRTLLVLLVLFVVLFVILMLQILQTNRPQEIPFERVFDDFSESDIQAVRLHDPHAGSAFTISRTADGTWISPDHAGALDQEAATLIARTIIALPYDRTLPISDDTDLSVYGFAEVGVFAIDVTLISGNSHGLLIGNLAPSSTVYYGLVDDRDVIYPIYRGAIDFLVAQYTSPPLA